MSSGSARRTPSLPSLLRQAQRAYSGALRAALQQAGHDDIPPNGLFVISALVGRDGVAVGRFVETLGISKQAVGQLGETLAQRGYLTRAPNPTDRRQSIVSLTPKGREVADRLAAAREAMDAALAAVVGAEDVACTRRTLAALADLSLQFEEPPR